MNTEYYEKYSNNYGGVLKDFIKLPKEVATYLVHCQESIKNDINFVSNFEEIYDIRPEFTVGFLNTERKTAFTCTNRDNTKCFIGISIGLVLSLHNILHEALALDSGFLDSYFENTYHPVDKFSSIKIKRSTFRPIDMESLLNRFCLYYNTPLSEDKQSVINAIVFTAISFICKHEMAHFFRDHSNIINSQFDVVFFDEEYSNDYFFFNTDSNYETQFMRAIESDADAQACIMMAREIEREILEDYTIDDINNEDILDEYYAIGIAIGVLFLCLDNHQIFNNLTIGTHPPCIIRFNNVLYDFQKYMEIVWECKGDIIIQEQMDIISEIENLAILLGYPNCEWVRDDDTERKNYLSKINDLINFMKDEDPVATLIYKIIDKHAKYDFIG